jgi:peptidoglycan/LPS O-acetylase OafA/YrhL
VRHTGNFFNGLEFPISYLAVDVFFLLSGIVIAGSYEKRLHAGLTSTAFIRIRIARIYPLYIFGSLITVLTVLGHFSQELTTIEISSALPFAFLLLPSTLNGFPLNGPAWSVFFELLANFAYGFFINLLSDRALKIIVLMSGIVLIAIVAAHPKHHLDVGFSFPYYAGIFRTTYSFFLGILLYRRFLASKERESPRFGKIIKPWLIIGIVSVILIANPALAVRPYFVILSVLFVFPALIYASLSFQPSGRGARVCRTLGIASYGIYALHVPLAIFISGVLAKVFEINVDRYAPWSGLIFLVLLFVLCLVLDRFYDRPARRLMLQGTGQSDVIQVSGQRHP